MTKEDICSLIVYVAMLAIALIVAFFVIQPAINNGELFIEEWKNITFSLGAIVIGIILNAIFVELGHFLGAKLGGYEILSFNIFGFCLYKVFDENRKNIEWKFKFPKPFDGLTGETIITPKKENANPMFYVFTPLVIFLIEVVLMYFAILFIKIDSGLGYLKYGSIIIATIGCLYLLYNYFPFHLDSTTDGYRLTLLSKKINVEAYNEYLRILGFNLIEDKSQNFKVFDQLTDFTADVSMLSVYQSMYFEEYDRANQLLDKIIEAPRLSLYTKLNAKIEKIYIGFITKPSSEAYEYYKDNLDAEEKKNIKKIYSMDSLRTYLLLEGLHEKSVSEVEYAVSKIKKAKETINRGLINVEKEFVLRAINKIKESGLEFKEDTNIEEIFNK